jgi:hypothetical protein
MPKVHTVKQGEHLASIAAANGFFGTAPIAKHPDNRALMQQRAPEVLMPGDRLTIPAIEPASFKVATGRLHTFVVRRPRLKLRVAFQKADGAPSAKRSFRASYDGGAAMQGTLTDDGLLDLPIPVATRRVDVTLAPTDSESEQIYQFFLGQLDPVDEYSGLIARLQNLGYLRPSFDDDETELRLAIEEFQCDAGLPIDGEPSDALHTKLVELHGA